MLYFRTLQTIKFRDQFKCSVGCSLLEVVYVRWWWYLVFSLREELCNGVRIYPKNERKKIRIVKINPHSRGTIWHFFLFEWCFILYWSHLVMLQPFAFHMEHTVSIQIRYLKFQINSTFFPLDFFLILISFTPWISLNFFYYQKIVSKLISSLKETMIFVLRF